MTLKCLSLAVLSCVLLACSVRLGSSPPGAAADDANTNATGAGGDDSGSLGDDGGLPESSDPSACTRVGNDTMIATGPAGTEDFSMVWDTDHYLVAYSDPTAGNGDIYTLAVGADGTPEGPAVAVDPTPAASLLPEVITIAGGYLVAWEEGTAGQAVLLHPLDPHGQPTGQVVTIASTNAAQARPVVATAPGGYAVAWMDDLFGVSSVSYAFLDPTFAEQGPQKLADNAAYPWVAGDANGAALLWSGKATPTSNYDIHFADLKASPLGVANDTLLRTGVPNDAQLGRMISTSFGYLSAWEDLRADDNQIFMALTDPNGKAAGGGLVERPETGDANWPHMAWNGSYGAVVYYQWRDSNPQIYMTFIDGSGRRLFGGDLRVSATPSGKWARFPDVAWDGKEFGVTWIDSRDGTTQLYFERVTCPNPGSL